MLVSVIITTYRRKPNIVTRALRSVMEQTFSDIEIIVVDDSPMEFNEKYEVRQTVLGICPTAIFLSTGGNKGATIARNTGIKEAKGVYIAFLDDDDEWLPEKIEKQLEGFTSDLIAMVYCGIIVNNEADNTMYVRDVEHYSGSVHDLLLLNSNFIGSTSVPLMRKTCIEYVGGFDESLESSQDYDLYIRLSKLYDVNFINGDYVIYHKHTGDRISTNDLYKLNGVMRLIEKYSDDLEQNPQVWVRLNRSLIRYYCKLRKRKEAFWIWASTVKRNPRDLLGNMKFFLLALFPDDSFLMRSYSRLKQKVARSIELRIK